MDLTKDVKSVERGRRRQATILDLKSKTRMVSWELDAGTDENAQVLTRAHIHPCKHTPARNIPPRATYPRTPRWPRPCVRLRPNQSPSRSPSGDRPHPCRSGRTTCARLSSQWWWRRWRRCQPPPLYGRHRRHRPGLPRPVARYDMVVGGGGLSGLWCFWAGRRFQVPLSPKLAASVYLRGPLRFRCEEREVS